MARYIFMHMPKTGGSWVKKVLQGNQNILAFGHATQDKLEALIRDNNLKVEDCTQFGTIRDPWSWYVSWYNHAQRADGPRKALIGLYGEGFESAIRGLLSKQTDSEYYANLLGRRPVEEWRNFPGGLYSFWFHRFYQNVRIFLDTANLYAGIKELLDLEVTDPPFNTADERTPDENRARGMSQELIELVREHDGPLAEKLGFEPFQPSKLGAVIRLD